MIIAQRVNDYLTDADRMKSATAALRRRSAYVTSKRTQSQWR